MFFLISTKLCIDAFAFPAFPLQSSLFWFSFSLSPVVGKQIFGCCLMFRLLARLALTRGESIGVFASWVPTVASRQSCQTLAGGLFFDGGMAMTVDEQ